jgi:Ca2+-binding RTX toxin-like protein
MPTAFTEAWGTTASTAAAATTGSMERSGATGSPAAWGTTTGKDAFVFNTKANGTTNVDSIRDFSARDDTVWLDNSVFAAVGSNGALKLAAFWRGSEAHDTSDRVIYDRSTGTLYYDPDGTGATEQVAFAKLTTKPALAFGDFLVV